MISQEQIAEWINHPITRIYAQRIEHIAAVNADIRHITVEKMDVNEVGASALARVNYSNGLLDAVNFDDVFELDAVQDEDEEVIRED